MWSIEAHWVKVNQPTVSKFIQCANWKAWFSFVGKLEDDQGFYCFAKVPDFVGLLSGMAGNKSGKSWSVPEFLRWSAQTLPTVQKSKVLKFILSRTSGNDGSNVSSRLCWCEQPNHYHNSVVIDFESQIVVASHFDLPWFQRSILKIPNMK